jgi:hypothetical protein
MAIEKAKAPPKGQIKEGLYLSLSVTAGLFLGIASGVALLAIFKLSFTRGNTATIAGVGNSIEVANNQNVQLRSTVEVPEPSKAKRTGNVTVWRVHAEMVDR